MQFRSIVTSLARVQEAAARKLLLVAALHLVMLATLLLVHVISAGLWLLAAVEGLDALVLDLAEGGDGRQVVLLLGREDHLASRGEVVGVKDWLILAGNDHRLRLSEQGSMWVRGCLIWIDVGEFAV